MANILAIADGNFEDASTWSTNTVPGADDNVWLNGHTVNINNVSEITISTLSNRSDAQTGAVQGGKLNRTDTTDFVFNADTVYAYNNVITINGRLFFNADIYCDASTLVKTDSAIYCSQALTYSAQFVPALLLTGNVTTESTNVGYMFNGANTSNYWAIAINGNVTHNNGYIATYFHNYNNINYPCGINGNVEAYNDIVQSNWASSHNSGFYNGEMNMHKGCLRIGNCKVTGDITVGEEAYIGISAVSYDGNLTLNTTAASGSTYAIAGFNAYEFKNVYNNSKTTYFTTGNYYTWRFTVRGDFHFGDNLYISGDYSNINAEFAEVIFVENGRWFAKNNDIRIKTITINNPDTFEWIYEGDGQPTFILYPYRGNSRLNYPNENTVADGTTYGVNNEYEGELQLPPEGAVLKDVTYGDKTGTLEVIALSGATATADNIAVVNLTEHQVNRVSQCATKETVDEAFEEFISERATIIDKASVITGDATVIKGDVAAVNLTREQIERIKNCATVSTVQRCFSDFKNKK